MKATGIVRRIDDLGRVVIPKEIRRTIRIREGDPLEIYTDKDGGVIFKKYSLLGGLSDFAAQLCESLNKTMGRVAVITDRDACIAVAGAARRELLEETGVAECQLEAVSAYGVYTEDGQRTYGGLFFAEVEELGRRPEGSEIAENRLVEGLPEHMTYPDIQPVLLQRVQQWLEEGNYRPLLEDLFEQFY